MAEPQGRPSHQSTSNVLVTPSGGITTLVACNCFTDCGEHAVIMQRLRRNDPTLGSNLDYRHILQQTIEKKRFTGDVLQALAVNKTMQSACLKGADITGRNVELLCIMLARNNTLQKLSLEGCNLQGAAFEEVAKHLAENKSIWYINLRSNFLEYEGAKQLFTHLPRSKVTSVNLSQNGIIDAAGGLFQIIKKTQKEYDAAVARKSKELPNVLTQLDINSNQISPMVYSKIMAIVNTNARLLSATVRQAKDKVKGAHQSTTLGSKDPAGPLLSDPSSSSSLSTLPPSSLPTNCISQDHVDHPKSEELECGQPLKKQKLDSDSADTKGT